MPAIGSHSSATSDAAWDAARNEGRIKTPVTQTIAAHFWAWREAGAWADTKAGYKFPHHEVSTGGMPGAANMRACSAVIAVLNGGRGGANIPAGDRQGVYDHVARHLRSGGNEPPPLGASPERTEAWIRDTLLLEPAPERADGLPLMPLGHAAWAILPDVLSQITALAGDEWAMQIARTVRPTAMVHRAQAHGRGVGSVAILRLGGVITPRPSLLSMLFGGSSGGLEGFRDKFREAMNDPEIGGVVIDTDSPGGLVNLVPETAAEIRAARGEKPVVAVANTMMASAAYWLGSQADEVVATPSAMVGGVGVYMTHVDRSVSNAKIGMSPTYVSAGRYKTEGNPDEPLEGEARAQWQSEVDDLYAMFTDGVAQGRGTTTQNVTENYGEGRTLLAARAQAAGLVDRIGTLQDTVAGMLGVGSSEGAAALAGRLRAEEEPGEEEPEEEPEEGEPEEEEAEAEPAEGEEEDEGTEASKLELQRVRARILLG